MKSVLACLALSAAVLLPLKAHAFGAVSYAYHCTVEVLPTEANQDLLIEMQAAEADGVSYQIKSIENGQATEIGSGDGLSLKNFDLFKVRTAKGAGTISLVDSLPRTVTIQKISSGSTGDEVIEKIRGQSIDLRTGTMVVKNAKGKSTTRKVICIQERLL